MSDVDDDGWFCDICKKTLDKYKFTSIGGVESDDVCTDCLNAKYEDEFKSRKLAELDVFLDDKFGKHDDVKESISIGKTVRIVHYIHIKRDDLVGHRVRPASVRDYVRLLCKDGVAVLAGSPATLGDISGALIREGFAAFISKEDGEIAEKDDAIAVYSVLEIDEKILQATPYTEEHSLDMIPPALRGVGKSHIQVSFVSAQ